MTSNSYQIKRALISVSDKSGIIDFAKELINLGIEIFSTGGTASALKEASVPVKSIGQLTGFPEILDGRVKTLHPNIHAGLLAKLDNNQHLNQLDEHHINSIDLLVVNLYPFEETLKKNSTHEELVEKIDIGGPAMLRAAAKNYLWTVPVINPIRYQELISILKENNNKVPESYRMELAGEVYSYTAYYDSVISGYFNKKLGIDFPEKTALPLKSEHTLRYGENPHQLANLYGNFFNIFTKLHGKELSYNNILDIDAASRLIIEFDELTLAIIKHTNPCGVANGNSLSEAFHNAYASDTVSPFGGIIIMNRPVDLDTAETIHPLFTELLIAPSFSEDALAILTKKRDRRIIKADFDLLRNSFSKEIKSVTGGFLMQSSNTQLFDEKSMKVVTNRQPSEDEMKSLLFGWKIVKHVKSNAIVFSASDRLLAVGAGQMSRVDSSRIAIEKAELMGIDLKGSTMASDAYFPYADGLNKAIEAGATAVIQPGGSVRDQEVIDAANENNIAMVFTGMRHFKH